MKAFDLLYFGCLEVLDTEGDLPKVDLDLLLLAKLLEEPEFLDLFPEGFVVDLLPSLSLIGVFDLFLFLSGEDSEEDESLDLFTAGA